MLRYTNQLEYFYLLLNLLQRFIPTALLGCLKTPPAPPLKSITFFFLKKYHIIFNSNNPVINKGQNLKSQMDSHSYYWLLYFVVFGHRTERFHFLPTQEGSAIAEVMAKKMIVYKYFCFSSSIYNAI